MLASINPLGERGRGNRYGITATTYLAGSVTGAGVAGLVFATLGLVLVGTVSASVRALLFAAAAVVALASDLHVGRLRPPSWNRQVNEDWLSEYRGWVYGAGFGFQLGLGLVTIVTTASVHLVWIGAFLVASPIAGLSAGAVFGLARAVPILGSAGVRTPADLRDRHLVLDRRDVPMQRATLAVEAAAALVVLVVLLVTS